MKAKATHTQAMFSSIADKYDFLNSLLSFLQDGNWRRFAISKCGPLSQGLALDVATGTAELARLMARRNGQGEIIGLDFCPEMLAKAKAKLAGLPEGKRIRLVLADLQRLPFPNNAFDCATIGFALRHAADIANTFQEIYRVVKPGGRVVSLELALPSSQPIRAIHYLYLFGIIPHIGGLISGKPSAYAYLPESIMNFPSSREIKGIMEGSGLREVKIYSLTLGTVTVHVGTKPA